MIPVTNTITNILVVTDPNSVPISVFVITIIAIIGVCIAISE